MPPKITGPTGIERGLMMPRRKRPGDKDRQHRLAAERPINKHIPPKNNEDTSVAHR